MIWLLIAFVAVGITAVFVAELLEEKLWQYPPIDQPTRTEGVVVGFRERTLCTVGRFDVTLFPEWEWGYERDDCSVSLDVGRITLGWWLG
jgi:hypothetical protein